MNRRFYLIFMVSILASCTNLPNYSSLPAFLSEDRIQMVVEIPAGTTHKLEYDALLNEFKAELMPDGHTRRVAFLPYPANYGFIPSTRMNPAEGGDGDAMDIVLLADAIPTGKVVAALPIAVLWMQDADEDDHKIIAIPVDPTIRILPIDSFAELEQQYPAVLDLIQGWFSSYKGPSSKVAVVGWGNDADALRLIKRMAL